MKKILTYILVGAAMVGFSGCLDDDNNYNYSDVNALVGKEITGMKAEYLLAFEEEVTITPTFEFTIDKEKPDVSYEWRLDGVLLPEETGPSCTFSFERGGVHEVTYTVIDNKTGVKFSRSCTLRVRSPFARGWLILSEDGAQNSQLSFVGASSINYKLTVTNGTEVAEIDRDSLVYNQVVENVLPGLGSHPKGLLLNAGYLSEYGEVLEIPDEVIVMQDRWAELNGITLEREVYTDEEFRGDLPQNFAPVSAAMTYSGKALLNSDGYIYWASMVTHKDFHSCGYTSVPLGKNRKFKGLYQSYKVNRYHGVMPVFTEDNEIAGLIDDAIPAYRTPDILEISSYSSQVYSVQTGEDSEAPVDERYKLEDGWKILAMMPASSNDAGYQDTKPGWVAIINNGSQYKLLYFQWKMGTARYYSRISTISFEEYELNGLTGFTDMAVFNNKKYVVIANGNDLYYFQYGAGNGAALKKLHTFNSPVKSLAANDIYVFYSRSYPVSWQPEHNGQLGVALEDNTFSIYEVWETEDSKAVATDVKINQLFPDPANPVTNNFGKIVDVHYKYGSVGEFLEFKY